MKVFISWSQERSQAVASSLSDWLGKVIQGVKPWMSSHSIAPGGRWAQELGGELQTSDYGVFCLTPENLSAPWLMFEAGAISKALGESRVVPYLFELKETDVGFPLAQFQCVTADKEGTLKLVLGINQGLKEPLRETTLEETFALWWPRLEEALKNVPAASGRQPKRSDRELLEEVVTAVRQVPTNDRSLRELMRLVLANTWRRDALEGHWYTVTNTNVYDVDFTCKTCGASVNIDTLELRSRDGERPPVKCPNCQRPSV